MTSRATPSMARPLGNGAPVVPCPTARSSSAIAVGLRSRDEGMDLEVAHRRFPDEQRPGHVAAVSRDLRPEVEEQDRVVEHRSIARRAVGQRRLRARQARDVEGERLGAAGPHQPLEPEREIRLRDARPDLRQQRRERPVRDRAGRGDPLELGRLLDRPVGLDPALDRDELDVRAAAAASLPRARATRSPASTATRRAPTDATSSGQRLGRSWYASKIRASGASRRAWIV